MATTKAPATSEEANQPAISPRQRLPVSRRMAAPARGSAGIRGASFTAVSSPQEPSVVHVRASGLAVEGHDDGQSDHDFCRRHHHREEGQDLAGQIPLLSGEGDQGQIHRVQLQLDGHEDDQGIAPDEHSHGPDGEQKCGNQQEVGDRCPHDLTSVAEPASAGAGGRSEGTSMVSSSAIRRRPWSMAPIAATINNTEVTSKGKKYRLNRILASAWVFPPRFTAARSGSCSWANPMPTRTAKNTSTTRAAPKRRASQRWPFSRSVSGTAESTPSNMITNRKRTMMAPAYTMIWTTKRKGDPRIRKNKASVKKLTIRNRAECTALRARTMAPAARIEMGAITQNTLQSATQLSALARSPGRSPGVAVARAVAISRRWRLRGSRTPSRSCW